MELGIATCESNITKTYQWWWVVRTVVRLTPSLFTAETTYNNIIEVNSKANNSLVSHTLHRERKGLVTLQLTSCCQGMQLSIR